MNAGSFGTQTMRPETIGTLAGPGSTDELRAPPAGLLAEITAGLNASNDLSALLERFLEPIVRLAGAQAGAVRMLSDSGEQLLLVSSLGLADGVCGLERAVDRHCSHCGAATDGQAMVWASDLSNCAERSGNHYFGTECKRLLAIPLQHRGRILGVYNLFFSGEREPSTDILRILKSIGELLGLALNNARLESENLRVTLLQERQHMAAEIHDSIAQTLTFVKMRLPLLQDAMVAHDDPQALKYLADVRQAVGEVHVSLREIVTHFRMRMDPLGLTHALDALVARFRQRTNIELSHVNSATNLTLPAAVESDVLHIAQEALANIERHSLARHAWFTFETTPAGFEIRIEDDGIGPAANDEQCDDGSHFGIGIMSERAHRLGGELTVAPRPAGGTLVKLAFPAAGRSGATP